MPRITSPLFTYFSAGEPSITWVTTYTFATGSPLGSSRDLGNIPLKLGLGQDVSSPRARNPRGPKVVIQPSAISSLLPNQLV